MKYYLEEETNLPYFFVIIALHTIENKKLQEHIHQYGFELTFF